MPRHWLKFLGIWLAGMLVLAVARLFIAPDLPISGGAQWVAMVIWVLFIGASADHLSRK